MQLLKMKQLEISDYQKLNDSFHKRLVYHVGIDCGFFVELNNMINAILYCLLNGYRFQLYSEDANFGTGKGWTEYFLPFCEEVLIGTQVAGTVHCVVCVLAWIQQF